MAKKIRGADGNYYTVKKPILQRVGFWVFVVIVFAGIVNVLGSGDDTKSKLYKVDSNEQKTDSPEAEKAVQQQVFKVGDTASIDGYEIKVNSVDYKNSSGWSKPANSKQFVIINLTVTNNTDEKQSFSPLDFSLNENGVSTIANKFIDEIETLNIGDLDPGASVTGNLAGEASSESSLKLRYEGNSFFSDHVVDFELR